MNKKEAIKKLALEILNDTFEAAKKNVDKALSSGAIDIDSWDENSAAMLVPKSIVMAVLTEEVSQISGKGTSFAKKQAKDAKNIGYFL